MIDPRQSVASVVLDHSECASIFQRHRIDFCCRGEQSVEAAAQATQLSLVSLLEELDRAVAERSPAAATDPRALTTAALVTHIVSTHHAYLRRTLPFLLRLAAKVGQVHGDHNSRLRLLDAAVNDLADALYAHLDEEEQTLFPSLTAEPRDQARLDAQLAAMASEHLTVAELLRRIRTASEDFKLPDWACNSYRTLFAELEHLERDVFTHVHLENHVLKPRFASA